MEPIDISRRTTYSFRRKEWRFSNDFILIFIYLILFIWQIQCYEINKDDDKSVVNSVIKINIKNADCHNCFPNSNNKPNTDNEMKQTNNERTKEYSKNKLHTKNPEIDESNEIIIKSIMDDLLHTIEMLSNFIVAKTNKTEKELEEEVLSTVDKSLENDNYEIADGIEIQPIKGVTTARAHYDDFEVENTELMYLNETQRSLFGRFGFERRLFNKIRTFFETHILSISLPKAARLVGFRSFGLKKLLVPILIGAQILKSFLVAMFLPSILGSFGKIVGKGLSHLSASSSQASYPPVEEQDPYGDDGTGQKDAMGYETDPQGVYAYPQDGQMMYGTDNDVNGLSDITMSRYGPGGAKVTYLPNKSDYYKNQIANTNYKVFHKIPASSMILSNYDPFYSPVLSRLDGIFARLGLAPTETSDPSYTAQTVSSTKLEACREQLICLMYSSPAKYAPYSNLVSAQLSRELNELRRPTSDNAEILRFFRYMRAARQGQEGADCIRAHPSCASPAEPSHTMISAYHDINKLVTARKLQ